MRILRTQVMSGVWVLVVAARVLPRFQETVLDPNTPPEVALPVT
jgi:hypothetical protein